MVGGHHEDNFLKSCVVLHSQRSEYTENQQTCVLSVGELYLMERIP